MPKVIKIDHIAILADDLEKSLSFWRDALGMELSHVEDIPAENSVVAFVPVGATEIELVKPTTSDSGLARLSGNAGPGMHHVCLEVDDIAAMLGQLKERGVQLINEKPMSGIRRAQVCLYSP